jgi:6-phosphogluconolactonase
MKKIRPLLGFVLLALFIQATDAPIYRFLIGTYTKKSKDGIHYASYNPRSGVFKIYGHSAELTDPSYLIHNKNQKQFYTISEAEGGTLHAIDFDAASSSFTEKNRLSTVGDHPCHISLDKTGQYLAVSNYTGGSLSTFSLNPDGSLKEKLQSFQYTGTGPNKKRQEKPHVHSATFSPDNTILAVADLGTDHIYTYAFDAKTGLLSNEQRIKLKEGSGPRHMVFHEKLPFLYVIQELSGTVSVLKRAGNQLSLVQEISSLEKNYSGENYSADIHISNNGQYLYASNRIPDNIVRYGIHHTTGRLSILDHTATGGKHPRNFAISPDGKFMFVANRDSDNICVFELKNGKMLKRKEELTVSMPVCIAFF